MKSRKQTYDHHIFRTSDELSVELTKGFFSTDRSYMVNVLKQSKEYLDQYSIRIYIDFVSVFEEHKLLSKKIMEFLIGFTRYYNSSNDIDNDHMIYWLKTRICKQSNTCEKNIIFTRLVHQYENEILEYLDIYLSQNLSDSKKRIKFVDDFKKKINQVKDQNQNNIMNIKPLNTINNIETHNNEANDNIDSYLNVDDYFSELSDEFCFTFADYL